MARVDYIDPIHHLSGKIMRRHRTVYCYRYSTNAKYTSSYTKSSKEASARQVAVKEKFRQASSQVNVIMSDVEQLDVYREAWKAQYKSGTGKYKTLRGYIFAQVFKTL